MSCLPVGTLLQIFPWQKARSGKSEVTSTHNNRQTFLPSFERLTLDDLLPEMPSAHFDNQTSLSSLKHLRLDDEEWERASAHDNHQTCRSPSRRLILDDLPPEVILHISTFLDAEATVDLHQANRRLFHTMLPSWAQLAEVNEARYIAKWMNVIDERQDERSLFCDQCRRWRLRSTFSASEIIRSSQEQEATCQRHARFWLCPHESLTYVDFLKLRTREWRSDYRRPRTLTQFECSRSKRTFSHNFGFWTEGDPWHIIIDSEIIVAKVEHRTGPNHTWDTICSTFTQANLDSAMSLIQAPICDHLLLSDRRVRNDFSVDEIDVRDWVWFNRGNDMRIGGILYPQAQRKDRSCPICRSMGGFTKWCFQAWVWPSKSIGQGTATIELHVLLSRSVGSTPPSATQGSPSDVHLRCHGSTDRSRARFRTAWDGEAGRVPLLLPPPPVRFGVNRGEKSRRPGLLGYPRRGGSPDRPLREDSWEDISDGS